MRPALALIAAVARNGVIGRAGALPWHLPEDLRRFRALTMGHAVIMGRRTWESLGRALPGRQNIVVSRRGGFTVDGALVVPSLDAALSAVTMPEPAFCIGGGELYCEALRAASIAYVTEIDRDFEGDTTFPPLPAADWEEVAREEATHKEAAQEEAERGRDAAAAKPGLRYRFVTYRRRVPHREADGERTRTTIERTST